MLRSHCLVAAAEARIAQGLNHHLGPAERDFHAGEFVLVVFIAFGFWIVSSVAAITSYHTDVQVEAFTDLHLWWILFYETIFGTVIFFILRHGGWRWRDFRVYYSNAGTVAGLLLAAAAIAFMMIVGWIVGPVDTSQPSASLFAVIVVSLVNPWYEELLVLAFVIESLRKRFGLATAVNVSVAIRLSYHLYQGPPAFIVFALFGLLMTLVYVRTGRLWPIIVAHALLDFVGLAGFD